MKIQVEIDVTPEELRRFLGLPDVGPLQQELMAKLRERIESGMTDYDPVKLMEPYLGGNIKSFEAMQNLFWNAMTGNRDDKKSGKS